MPLVSVWCRTEAAGLPSPKNVNPEVDAQSSSQATGSGLETKDKKRRGHCVYHMCRCWHVFLWCNGVCLYHKKDE